MSAELAEPASKVELPAGVGGGGEIPTFDITLRVRRYNPEVSEDARWDDFKLTMYGTDRVLDALHKIKWKWTAPSPSAGPAPTASAARMPCASMAATALPARPC
jgi:hypothetical protein